jgi:hypothetical protein
MNRQQLPGKVKRKGKSENTMNILIEFTTLNHRSFHSVAKRLKEYFPDSRFAGLVGLAPNGEEAIDFLKNQKEIKYEFLILRHELAKEASRDEIDLELLRNFEEGLKEKSIWRLVSADRIRGSAYIHGALVPKMVHAENATRDNILKFFSGSLKRMQKIFDDFDVDVFVPAMCMGTVDVFILEELCRRRGIPYAAPNTLRIKNYFAFGSDVALSFPHVDKAYLELISGQRQADLTPARKLYDELVSEFENSQHIDRQHPVHTMVKTQKPSRRKLFVSSARAAVGAIKNWIKMRRLNTSGDIRRQPYNMATLMDNISLATGLHRQTHIVLNPDFGQRPQPGEKYIYYPLHVNPEYSTNFQGTMWMDQAYTIEQLSKSIPVDWFVYVKEHPAMLIARVRPDEFYKRIKKLPNVRMASVGIDSHEMIMNSQMVAIVTGTTGWEAILRGKPVLQFVNNYFDVLGLSRTYSTIENLSFDIRDELKRMAGISPEERTKRIVHYLAALLEHGYVATHGPQFFYEPGTQEQYELCGKEMADALIKHWGHIGFLSRLEHNPASR